MENNIIEGDILIAKFDGKYTTDSKEWVDSDKRLVREYEYHSSWDWLMPIVGKIRNDHYIEISFYGDYTKCLIICTKADKMIMLQRSLEDNTTIEIVWLAVVEFIKWYNKEQNEHGK